MDIVLCLILSCYLQTASTEDEWKRISSKFKELWNFFYCIGAVDKKDVIMKAPLNSGIIYYNYKRTHSIGLMGIANAEYKLLYVDIGVNGSILEGRVVLKCHFFKALQENYRLSRTYSYNGKRTSYASYHSCR